MSGNSTNRINYLDGLRGWAALIVCLEHTVLVFTYDAPNQPQFLRELREGYLRILVHGTLSVKIFFVLSGIVLSRAFIKNQDFSKLASLVVKRIPRLGIPIFVMAIITHILMQSGLMFNFKAIETLGKNTWLYYCNNFESTIPKVVESTFLHTFFGDGNPYNNVLWTMPHEMLGSIFVAVILLVANYLNKRKAVLLFAVLLAGMATMAYQNGSRTAYSSTLICFLFGILLSYYMVHRDRISRLLASHIAAIATSRIMKLAFKDKITRLLEKRIVNITTKRIVKLALPVSIVYLYYNHRDIDLKTNLIAILIVSFVILSPVAQKVLSGRISVFLGRISFPLYVMHMTVICSLTCFLLTKEYDYQNTSLVALYCVITVAASIAAACILYPVEKFAISFSEKIYRYLSSDEKNNLAGILGKLKGKESE